MWRFFPAGQIRALGKKEPESAPNRAKSPRADRKSGGLRPFLIADICLWLAPAGTPAMPANFTYGQDQDQLRLHSTEVF